MKFKAFLLLFFTAIVFSCKNKETSKTAVLSSGKINTLSIIINDALWNGEIGDSIRKKFAAPVDGLPQEEPLFTINQYPIKALDGNKIFSRNIIVIKKEELNKYEFKKNEFANPQNIIHISGKTSVEILSELETNSDNIIDELKKSEIIFLQDNIKRILLSDLLIKKKFKTRLNLPNSYRYALVRPNFIWLKKEIVSGSNSVLIYTVPFKSILKNNNISDNIIRVRDSVSGNYVRSRAKNSKMITEVAYAPYFSTHVLDHKRVYQTKGTWELQGDFMSGSFLNYAIIDQRRKRFLIIEGFCYAPSSEKRDLMFELEAILKSVRIIK